MNESFIRIDIQWRDLNSIDRGVKFNEQQREFYRVALASNKPLSVKCASIFEAYLNYCYKLPAIHLEGTRPNEVAGGWHECPENEA